jgi:hypothetical protein
MQAEIHGSETDSSSADSVSAVTATQSWRNRVFCLSILIQGMAFWALLRADRYYIDDIGRARSGYLSWTGDGRPLSNVVMELFNLGTPLTDLSPLPLFSASALMAMCAVLIGRRFRIRNPWVAVLTGLPLALNPFFLENLSYKFDALTMSLAVLLAVLPVTLAPGKWRSIGGGLALLACLCLYQPALNIFLIFLLLEFLLVLDDAAKGGSCGRLCTIRFAQLAAAVALYLPVVAYTRRGGYSAEHGQFAPSGELRTVMWANLQNFWEYVARSLSGLWAWPLVAALGVGLVCVVWILLVYVVRKRSNGSPFQFMVRVLLSLAILLCLPLVAWGPMLMLEHPVLAPRVVLGLGAFWVASFVLARRCVDKLCVKASWLALPAILPIYCMVVFATAFGNTESLQKQFEDRVAASLVDDIAMLSERSGVTRYVLLGQAPRSPVVKHFIVKYPFLNELVPIHLTEGWGWAREKLKHYDYFEALESNASGGPDQLVQARELTCTRAPVVTTAAYDIWLMADVAVVRFVNQDSACQLTRRR